MINTKKGQNELIRDELLNDSYIVEIFRNAQSEELSENDDQIYGIDIFHYQKGQNDKEIPKEVFEKIIQFPEQSMHLQMRSCQLKEQSLLETLQVSEEILQIRKRYVEFLNKKCNTLEVISKQKRNENSKNSCACVIQ